MLTRTIMTVALILATVTAATAADKKSKIGKQVTVTGCLAKGDDANEYRLTSDGKTYGLFSKTVDLSAHVGHKVSVTGTTLGHKAEEKMEGGERHRGRTGEAKTQESSHLDVSSLQMIDTKCP
jgi:hypothetical protein